MDLLSNLDTNCKAFKVEVWDWDLIGNDFMGQVVIPLTDLPKGRETETWYKLVPRNPKKDVVSGDILIRILYLQETSLQLSTAANSISKRLMENSSSQGTSLASTTSAAISEEEYAAMDDMRTGEIDLMMPALIKSSSSLPCLQIGLPAFAKWATTSSVAERISILDKYQATLFDLLVNCATEFKYDSVAVFYALHAFGPFLRLFEAKQYFTSKVASLLANSLQSPPLSMGDEDRVRHCANCLISLANACTANLKELRNQKEKEPSVQKHEEAEKRTIEATEKCIKIVVSSGALGVALQMLNSNIISFKDITCTKHILALIIKIIPDTAVQELMTDSSFLSDVSKLLSTATDPVVIWLALDMLARYAHSGIPYQQQLSLSASSISPGAAEKTSDSNTTSKNASLEIDIPVSPMLDQVTKIEGLLESINRIAALDFPHAQGANVSTAIVYTLYTLSKNFASGTWSPKALEPKILKMLIGTASSAYVAHIPAAERKSLLPERSFKLLVMLAKLDPTLQKQLSEEFAPLTSHFLVRFYAFPSVLELAAAYIMQLHTWGVLMKEEAAEQVKKATEELDAELTTHAKEVLAAFAEKITAMSS